MNRNDLNSLNILNSTKETCKMGTRQIPKNYRNVTGIFMPGGLRQSSQFESTLERDFLLLLDFDKTVISYNVQPMTIEYSRSNNKLSRYTPDVLVHYRGSESTTGSSVLYEVKYRQDLKDNWSKFKHKFRAAIRYAKSNGLKFRIITEREIRNDYLENVKFLYRYRNDPINDMRLLEAIDILEDIEVITPEELCSALSSLFSNKSEALYLIWQMLARHYIKADLNKPLTMNTPLWISNQK